MKTEQRKLAEGALYTDLYQLTMAQLYFREGLHQRPAQFDYFFRDYPDYGEHRAGFVITAGLDGLLDWMESVTFTAEDIAELRGTQGREGDPLFDDAFLDWLERQDFGDLEIRAVEEGRVVHANAPIATVTGPVALAQILETPFLNFVNYPSLVATKAARIAEVARGGPVLDFGMRRGHERGVNAGTRGALIGGADFTSNTGTSYALGLPPKGTHAHSMVQAFMALGEGEIGSFRAYAQAYPDDCLLLVDTVDTLASGVPNAIEVFQELRHKGHEPVGIRLDSGDLAHLAVRSAAMLSEAGFADTIIVLSNQLDELNIWQILSQIESEAPEHDLDPDDVIDRLSYGVGTRLITSKGDAALDGVYKLVAIERDGSWEPAIKLSETVAKIPNPGEKRLWRIYDARGFATADLMTLADEDPREWEEIVLRHPIEAETRRTLATADVSEIEDLMMHAQAKGKRRYQGKDLEEIRARREHDLQRLDAGVKRLLNPHIYHVSISERLWDLKQELIESARS